MILRRKGLNFITIAEQITHVYERLNSILIIYNLMNCNIFNKPYQEWNTAFCVDTTFEN